VVPAREPRDEARGIHPPGPDPGALTLPAGGFVSPVTAAEIRREKARARELRASAWWKRRIGRAQCGYCGHATPSRELTMDHRVPLVRGGRSVRSNLVPACRACNAAKKYLLPVEWAAYLTRLADEADKIP
jgi:5-methylcytosine-specific restriction enzyme A